MPDFTFLYEFKIVLGDQIKKRGFDKMRKYRSIKII